MRSGAGDSWRDTAEIPPRHAGCTGRLEEQGERKFLVPLPALTETHLCRNGAEPDPQ